MSELKIKRIYLPPAEDDGARILVDRLWPRGISKEKAQLTEWCKSVSPSNELRKWFGHDPEKFAEFKNRYVAELKANPDTAEFKNRIAELLKNGNVTLLYGAKDDEYNNAVALKEWLEK